MAEKTKNRDGGKPQRHDRGNNRTSTGRAPGGSKPGERGSKTGGQRGSTPRPSSSSGGARPRSAGPRVNRDALWFYGQHAVEAAIKNSRRQVKNLLATEEAMARMPILQRSGLAIRPCQASDIERLLARDAVHQGVAAEVAPLPTLQLERVIAIQPEQSFILALDQVTDPRNFGAILRTAAGLGVRAVITPERRSAPLNGAAAKAASGALDIVPIVEVVNLSRALERLKVSHFVVTGLDGESEHTIEQAKPAARRVLVLGSEGDGMRRLTGEKCDEILSISIAKAMESLNVSVAAGIAIHQLLQTDRRG